MGVVPYRENVANRLRVFRIYECLTDFVPHRVKVGIGNSKFSEDSAGVYRIVEFQCFCKLELDGHALLRYGWRRNRKPLQQSTALAKDERIADRATGDRSPIDAGFIHHPSDCR